MAMKKKIKIALIVFGAVVFVWYGYVGAVKYKNWKWYQGMKNEAAKFEAEIADKKAKIAADIYGGKTPQETLDMFIAAVEKGDYELASKYFVVERQEEELKSLKNSELINIKNLLDPLKRTEIVNLRKQLEQMYDKETKQYNFTESKEDYVNRLYDIWGYDKIAYMETKIDGYDFSVSFIKYPSNLWKIDEI